MFLLLHLHGFVCKRFSPFKRKNSGQKRIHFLCKRPAGVLIKKDILQRGIARSAIKMRLTLFSPFTAKRFLCRLKRLTFDFVTLKNQKILFFSFLFFFLLFLQLFQFLPKQFLTSCQPLSDGSLFLI